MTKPFAIPRALAWNAFQRVNANGGSAGIDEESIDAFEEQPDRLPARRDIQQPMRA
jgi:hypothetical protein